MHARFPDMSLSSSIIYFLYPYAATSSVSRINVAGYVLKFSSLRLNSWLCGSISTPFMVIYASCSPPYLSYRTMCGSRPFIIPIFSHVELVWRFFWSQMLEPIVFLIGNSNVARTLKNIHFSHLCQIHDWYQFLPNSDIGLWQLGASNLADSCMPMHGIP